MSELFSLEGEVAVVTGALGKLGPIWVETLLGAGARVVALDHPEARPSPGYAALEGRVSQNRLRLLRADVCERTDLEAARAACEEGWGAATVLVNNAGIDQPPAAGGGGHRLEEIPLEANRTVFDVNVLGLFLVSQVFGGRMAERGRGAIVNIGSLYASVAPDSRFYEHLATDPPFLKPPAYGASKAAVVNLTRYLATLWASRGVRVNALSPGGVLGEQDEAFKNKFCARVPLGRMATAADLSGPLLFLASAASSYVTGTELIVDGGFTAW